MRSTADRIRQALSFEFIGIVIVTPFFAWAFDHHIGDMGAVVVLSATAATLWNYIFNLVFNHVLNWRRRDVRKTMPLRIVHAVLFEATLLVPLFAGWLGVPLIAALVMEIFFAVICLGYAFVFIWGYDTFFPSQGTARAA